MLLLEPLTHPLPRAVPTFIKLMLDSKPITGARALLFDRLVDVSPDKEHEQPLRILNREQLKASVRRELERLLNTRCSIPLHRLGEEERSVVNYGIPDFSSLSPRNADDHALIASIVAQTIAAFEPRLRQVRVEVEPVFGAESALWLNINAELVVGVFAEPVSFPVLLNGKTGTAEIA
jgi:type VI secretion system protein ImpF